MGIKGLFGKVGSPIVPLIFAHVAVGIKGLFGKVGSPIVPLIFAHVAVGIKGLFGKVGSPFTPCLPGLGRLAAMGRRTRGVPGKRGLPVDYQHMYPPWVKPMFRDGFHDAGPSSSSYSGSASSSTSQKTKSKCLG